MGHASSAGRRQAAFFTHGERAKNRQSMANNIPQGTLLRITWRTTAFLPSFPTGFPGSVRIVPEITSAGFASCAACFFGTIRIVSKITRATSVFLLCHR